ncbi:hypothetical protein ACPA9J_04370 [Pseudomonas aeruginosa]
MGLEYERYHNDELILRSIPSRNPMPSTIRRAGLRPAETIPSDATTATTRKSTRWPPTRRTRSSSARNGAALLGVRFDRYRRT